MLCDGSSSPTFGPMTAYNVGWGPHDLYVRDLADPIDGLPE